MALSIPPTLKGSVDLANTTEGPSHDGTLDCGTVTNGALLIVTANGTMGQLAQGGAWTTPTKNSGTATIGTVSTIGDTGGGDYVSRTTVWRIPITAGGTLVLSVGDTGDTFGAVYRAYEYTGQDTTDPIDGEVTSAAAGSGNFANSTLGSSEVPTADDDVFAAVNWDSDAATGKGITPGTNFTELNEDVSSADYVQSSTNHRAGSVSTSATIVWPTQDGTPTVYSRSGVAFIVRAAASSGASGSGAPTLGALTASGTAVETISGTAALALGALAASGSGTIANPVSGSGAPTLGDLVAAGSGSVDTDVSGTAAVTLGTLTAAGTGVETISGAGASTLGALTASGTGTQVTFPYPATRSGRNWLDQYGNRYALKCMASWGMPQRLSDADITTALEGVAGRGFNAILIMLFGYHINGTWTAYENIAGDPVFTGTPYQSSLGSAWDTVDWIVQEATRLEMSVVMVNYAAFGSTGIRADLEAAYTDDPQNLVDYGEALATRYAAYPNILWHVGADDSWGWNTTIGDAYESIHEGIRNIEGSTHRLVVGEQNNGSTAYGQWPEVFDGTGNVRFDANGVYDWDDQVVVQFEGVWNESGATSFPVWDCEPPYVGNPSASGAANRQEMRERVYSTYLEGGCGLNFGHEDWWPFGADGLGTEGLTWQEVMPDSPYLSDAELAFTLLDGYLTESTWGPGALVSGAGSGDSLAAIGYSDVGILVYFPNSRGSIVVDTTVVTGSSNVRLRWYDPTNGTYDTIASSEPQNATRAVTHPGNNAAGDGDWVLVVDLLDDTSASGATTLSPLTASGTAVETISGSGAPPLGELTASGTGSVANPVDGSAAVTLGELVATGTGTETISATGASTLGDLAAAGSGAQTITGTGASTLGELTAAGTGTQTITGSGASTLGELTANGTAIFGDGVTGSASIDLAPITASGTGFVAPTGSGASTLGDLAANGSASATFSASGAPTLAALTGTGTGAVEFSGAGSSTLGDLSASGTAVTSMVGAGSSTLGDLTANGTGIAGDSPTGSGAPTLGALTALGTGFVVPTGSGSPTLEPLIGAGSGTAVNPVIGAGASVFAPLTGAGVGLVPSVVTSGDVTLVVTAPSCTLSVSAATVRLIVT